MGLLGKLAVAALALGVVGAAAFWFLTMPTRLGAAEIAALGAGDAAPSIDRPPASEAEPTRTRQDLL